MKVDPNTPKKLFQRDIRYIIPPFQRPYVWDQEKQWEPLWEDIRNTAERYIEELAQCGSKPEAEKKTGTHFMGAIVLKQKTTATASIDERDVIDGQQRMTTLQILLDAAQEVFEREGHIREAQRMSRLVLNEYAEGEERFKLWPTAHDSDAFEAAMTNGNSVNEHEDNQIVKAHEFFQLQVKEWLEHPLDCSSPEERVHGLETALMGLMEVVTIDLDLADDPFIIFETLNARGTPLLASDLVKNLVMQTSEAEGLDSMDIHQSHWMQFENKYWRTDIRQGRLSRPRIDVLLDYWLEQRLCEEVASHDVFNKFRTHLSADCNNDVKNLLSHLKDAAISWEALDNLEAGTPAELFVYRWRVIEAGPLMPLVLALFTHQRQGLITERTLHRSLRVLESYLIRRMICRMTTKNYNRLFIELLREIKGSDIAHIDVSISDFLKEQNADASLWPSDLEVLAAVKSLPLYRLLTRGRLRIVLEALESHLRKQHCEEPQSPRKLTIEHLMPRKWSQNWTAPSGEDLVQATYERDRRIHTLGNLTLVTKTLNPSMSNGPWESKKLALEAHSSLLLNRRLLEDRNSVWDDDTIEERSGVLGNAICSIWPRPE